MFIQPLPYHNPQRIVTQTTYSPQNYTQPASYPEFVDWRRDAQEFCELAANGAFSSAANAGCAQQVGRRLSRYEGVE